MSKTVIDLSILYEKDRGAVAKVGDIPVYVAKAVQMIKDGDEVVLTGAAPVWMYLVIAHALHGKVRALYYTSPVTGEIEVFNHNPF
jgi:hypothetical protein